MLIAIYALVLAFQDQPLRLTCLGSGAANKSDTATASAFDNHGNSANSFVTTRRSEAFDSQVDISLNGAESSIRLPRSMLPKLHGGERGWFKIKNLVASDAAFDGTVEVNFINSPKFHVDRRTGVVSIDGKAGHFMGRCERLDDKAENKF